MITGYKKLVLEMGVIVLIAVVAGSVWNRRILADAWTGKAIQKQESREMPAQDAPLPLGLMQVKELFDRKEAVLVDARDGTTYAAGHISGALSLPLGEADSYLQAFQGRVAKSQPVVVYCNGFDCHDSMVLGKKLLAAGYGTVYVFLGGYPEWRDAGYPVEGKKP